MAKADIAAGKAYVSLSVKKAAFTKSLEQASKQLNEFGSGIMRIGAAVSGMGLAITGGFAAATSQFASTGAAIQKLATQTGVSASELSALQFAAMQTGAEFDDISGALEELNIRMGETIRDGTGPAAEAFKTLGLNADELGKMMPIDRLMEVGEALAGVQDAATRQFLADEIIGGDAFKILPLLVQGRKGMEDLMQAGRELGVVLTDEDARAASQLSQAFSRMRAVMASVVTQIGAALAPVATELAEAFTSISSAVVKFVRNNRNLIVIAAKVGVVLTVVGGAIAAIGAGFIGAGLAIGGVLSAISAFTAVAGVAASIIGAVGSALGLLLTPVGLVVAALAGGAFAWLRFTESGRTAVSTLVTSVTTLFGNLRKTVGETMGGIVEAVRAGDLALAGQIAMVGLQLAFTQGLEAIHNLFGETIGTLVGQVLSGDFTGAWATAGSTILDSMSQVASGIVGMFTSAINTVTDVWATAVNKLVGFIFGLVEGIAAAFEAVTGIEVETEMERSRKLEAQRRQMGLAPQNDDIASQIAGGTYKDPGIEAIRQQIQGITSEIDAGRKSMTDATGQAVTDATAGQSQAASDQVNALQAQLAALRQEAQTKLAEDTDIASSRAAMAASGGMGGSMGGRASIATNSLAALSALVSSPQDRMAKIGEQQVKRADKMIDKLGDVVVGIDKLGMFHP